MAELIKMSELVARAGVEKSTIQHYLREGLLPKPAQRPHRNMAYYNADLVERIGLIRQLQTEHRLPLAKIKKLFGNASNMEDIRRWLDQTDPAPEPVTEFMSRTELLTSSGLTRVQLDRLEELHFLRPSRKGRSLRYSPNDISLVLSVAAMRKAGLNEDNGFALDDLHLYMDAMHDLLVDEIALVSRILGKVPREKVIKLAEAGLDGTNRLLVSLRRRIISDLLEDGTLEKPCP